jgi:hypothetical protein
MLYANKFEFEHKLDVLHVVVYAMYMYDHSYTLLLFRSPADAHVPG